MVSTKTSNVGGVVLPPDIMERWRNVFVRVKESGTQIILESGALPISMKKTDLYSVSKKAGEVYL